MILGVGEDVQVEDDGGAAQVEEVLAPTEIAGALALPAADVGQRIVDLRLLAQLGAPDRGLLPLA
jgi:hypothetical protein